MSRTTTQVVDADGVVYGSLPRRSAAFWLDWFVWAMIFRVLHVGDVTEFAIVTIYFVALEGLIGATLAKRLLRLRVVDEVSLAPIGIPRAVLRYGMRFISIFPVLQGYFVAMSDVRSRGWHDMLAHSVVIAE